MLLSDRPMMTHPENTPDQPVTHSVPASLEPCIQEPSVKSLAEPLTVEAAHHCLKQFDAAPPIGEASLPPTAAERTRLQAALGVVATHSEHQLLGICAASQDEGVAALMAYAHALGYQPVVQLPTMEGAVYLKFNPLTGLVYGDRYSGSHRGVLVSCQSADGDGVNDMYGHLPLDLFPG
jgi:hypothetical protein